MGIGNVMMRKLLANRKLIRTLLRAYGRGPAPHVSDRFVAAPLDRPALIRTSVTIVVLLCVLVLLFFLHEFMPLVMLLWVPIIAMPAFAYAASPLGYAIDNRALYVERKALRTLRVPLNQIAAVKYMPVTSLQGAIRVYGTGGLFGWAGRYRLPGLGPVSMHATNLEQLIIIQRRHRKPILISPADSAAFLTGLRRQFKTIQA
jgi:Bacterial PH domain